MRRIWHPYTSWECWKRGMWRSVTQQERAELLQKAIEFTGNAELYGSFMLRVVVEWPLTCEHHMTDVTTNRRAFVGHAATCLAIQCPEDITRQAWAHLSQRQQDEANAKALDAIHAWENRHSIQNTQLRLDLETPWIPGGHTGYSRPAA